MLVRNYLWSGSVHQLETMGDTLERTLTNSGGGNRRRGPSFDTRWERLSRHFSRDGGQLLLLRDGEQVYRTEEPEYDMSSLLPTLPPGLHEIEYGGEYWLVLVRDVNAESVDRFLIVHHWSPSVRLVQTLILYQTLASGLVLLLALLVATYSASRLARPLEELRNKSRSVGQKPIDNLQSSIVEEVSELQESFIDMSHRVEESIASQRQFVADASHELKTPLTAISGMLELLQERSDMDYEDRIQAISVAKKETERMQSLISDLLLLSSAQSKRSSATKNIRLADPVREQIEILKVLFPEQSYELKGDLDTQARVDSNAFSRVLRNLLENASRYNDGEPIEVELQRSTKGATLTVTDRGPGIPEEKLDQLFERFYRIDSGRARSHGGHGLGLAIVKALVEEANGTIQCTSEVGRGTQFKVWFPTLKDEV